MTHSNTFSSLHPSVTYAHAYLNHWPHEELWTTTSASYRSEQFLTRVCKVFAVVECSVCQMKEDFKLNICSFVHQYNTFTSYILLIVDMFRPYTAISRCYSILSGSWCSVMPISCLCGRVLPGVRLPQIEYQTSNRLTDGCEVFNLTCWWPAAFYWYSLW
jgi:hypothetical protein